MPSSTFLDVTFVAPAAIAKSSYVLFALENEFGDRCGVNPLAKATLSSAGSSHRLAISQNGVNTTTTIQLRADVYAAAPGSYGASAFDDQHLGELRVDLAQLPTDGTMVTAPLALGCSASSEHVTVQLALNCVSSTPAPAAATPSATTTMRRVASSFDPAGSVAADSACGTPSTGSSFGMYAAAATGHAASPHSPLMLAVADAAAQRIAELETELATLRHQHHAVAAATA